MSRLSPSLTFDDDGRLVLPAFEFSRRQPDPPHRVRTVAQNAVPNAAGLALITYKVQTSTHRNNKRWWLSASWEGGFRASNTLMTKIEDVAKVWIEHVENGTVCREGDEAPAKSHGRYTR